MRLIAILCTAASLAGAADNTAAEHTRRRRTRPTGKLVVTDIGGPPRCARNDHWKWCSLPPAPARRAIPDLTEACY